LRGPTSRRRVGCRTRSEAPYGLHELLAEPRRQTPYAARLPLPDHRIHRRVARNPPDDPNAAAGRREPPCLIVMPLNRFSSRRHRLYDAFLGDRLKGARSYDRIAGYFQSSLLGLAAAELKAIPQVRIVCNTEVNPADVHAIRHATGSRRHELEDALL